LTDEEKNKKKREEKKKDKCKGRGERNEMKL
jgi:hypothetical protein